jgi:hypothetical protein
MEETVLDYGMASLQQKVLDRLADVREGATMCPGKLARDCGTTLRQAREDILELARAGKITLRQHGKRVPPDGLKGPFRVSK